MRLMLLAMMLVVVLIGMTGCSAANPAFLVSMTPVAGAADQVPDALILNRFPTEDPEQVKITIAYMTAAEWAALNAQADRDTLANLRAEKSQPDATLDQIPEPVGMTPVLPRGSDRELLIVDIRGIALETKVGMDAPKVFDNVQLVYDLRLAAEIDGSMQSPISAFRLEGQQITPQELEELLASLTPVETPVPNELDAYPTVDPALWPTPLPPPTH